MKRGREMTVVLELHQPEGDWLFKILMGGETRNGVLRVTCMGNGDLVSSRDKIIGDLESEVERLKRELEKD